MLAEESKVDNATACATFIDTSGLNEQCNLGESTL